MKRKTQIKLVLGLLMMVGLFFPDPFLGQQDGAPCPIVDTGQDHCYDNWQAINCPHPGEPFYGQDAQVRGNQPAYRDNGDGTATDLVTGLMWSKAVDSKKVSLDEALEIAAQMTLGGHTDWRVPNIKELYSLIDFRGQLGSFHGGFRTVPYINTNYFDFSYGDTSAGERIIDAQWLTCTRYTSTTMNGASTLFGVNFADGRIKGYAINIPDDRVRKNFMPDTCGGLRMVKMILLIMVIRPSPTGPLV